MVEYNVHWITKLIIALLLICIMVSLWVIQPMISGTSRSQIEGADPERLRAHVEMLSLNCSPRYYSNIENLEKAASYVRSEFARAGLKTSDQPFNVGERTYLNVRGFAGKDSTERIIVGAHYDTAGELPGADDNASGVAGLIELARLLGARAPGGQVELVAYSLEEPPFFGSPYMGSAIHASSLKRENVNVRLMFSLEMIGYFTDLPNSQQFPSSLLKLFYPSTGNFITVVGRIQDGLIVRRVKKAMSDAAELPVHSINAPTFIPGVDFSDHRNYWLMGYNAVMITDTAFYRNPAYHTSEDVPNTLDYKRMAMVVEGVYAAIEKFSR
jgi:hypothetical protein